MKGFKSSNEQSHLLHPTRSISFQPVLQQAKMSWLGSCGKIKICH
jgi:hypothetical protein